MNTGLMDELKRVVIAYFELKTTPDQLPVDTELFCRSGLGDSLDAYDLAAVIGSKFGVMPDWEDAEAFKTITTLYDWLNSRLPPRDGTSQGV